jgi:hypothetical protein
MKRMIKNSQDLKAAIADLEKKKTIQEEVLLNELHAAYEDLKPLNVLKKATSSPVVRNSLLKGAIGLGAGILSKNLLVGSTGGFLKKVVGNILEFGIATLVAKNSDKLKEKGKGLLRKLF